MLAARSPHFTRWLQFSVDFSEELISDRRYAIPQKT